MPLIEKEDSIRELEILIALTETLLWTHKFDEMEALLPRVRETVQALSRRMGRPSDMELTVVYLSARLHEVSHFLASRWEPLHPVRASTSPRPVAFVTGSTAPK